MPQDTTSRHNRIREALGRIYDQHPPQVREYLRRYQEDPKSRVFAPLAEAYRRLGRVDEALGLCLDGLENHPDFHGGRVALAKCYIDKQNFDQAKEQLERVVQSVPENLLAQRLLGDVWMALSHPHQALHCYKMALMLAPTDVQLEQKVRLIERAASERPKNTPAADETQTATVVIAKPLGTQAVKAPAPEERIPALWEVAEAGEPVACSAEPQASPVPEGLTNELSWVGEPEEFVEAEPDSKRIEDLLNDSGLDLEENYQVENMSTLFRLHEASPEITTATLGDLYFSQGQFDKSLRIYERLAQKDPSNRELVKKIDRCKGRMGVTEEQKRIGRKAQVLKSVLHRIKTQGMSA